MAYQSRVQYQRPPQRRDPGDYIQGGLNLWADAYAQDQRLNEERAQKLREFQQGQEYLGIAKQDREQALERAQGAFLSSPEFKSMAAQNPGLAAAVARKYGIDIGQETVFGEDPTGLVPQAPAPPQAGPPMAEQPDFGRLPLPGMPQMQSAFNMMQTGLEQGAPRGPGAAEMDRQAMLTARGLAPPPLNQGPPAPQQDLNAERAQKVKKALGYRLTMGQPGLSQNEDLPRTTLYDSVAERERKAEATRMAQERMRAAFPDPEEARIAAALTGAGFDAETTGKLLMSVREKAADRELRRQENELGRQARHEDTRMIANAMAMRGMQMTPGQQETAERGWSGQAEQIFKDYKAGQDYNANVKSLNNYRGMLADLKSGNAAQMVGGLGAWIKEKSGGSAVVTENEIRRYAEDVIPWDEKVQRQWDIWVNGGRVSPGYVRPFTQALEKSIIKRQEDLIGRIGTGAEMALSTTGEPAIQARAKSARLRAISPLLTEEQMQSAIDAQSAVQEPNPEKRAAMGAREQSVGNAKKVRGMMNPRDREAIEWAQSHPNDPRAKEILRQHGF